MSEYINNCVGSQSPLLCAFISPFLQEILKYTIAETQEHVKQKLLIVDPIYLYFLCYIFCMIIFFFSSVFIECVLKCFKGINYILRIGFLFFSFIIGIDLIHKIIQYIL